MTGPTAPRAAVAGRDHAVDALRILAVLLLVPFHVALAFSHEGFHVVDPRRHVAFDLFCAFVYAWHMPLLMFLAGMSAHYALRRRTTRAFVGERFRRILLPLVFGVLVVVPPQTWIERLQQGRFDGSLLAFWPTVLTTGVYPEGNLTWNHLWFLAYLFVIALAALPLLRRLRGGVPDAAVARFASARGLLLLGALPLLATQFALRPFWMYDRQNLYGDFANLAQDAVFFLAGALVAASPALGAALRRHGRLALGLGLATMAAHLSLPRLFPDGPPAWAPPGSAFVVTASIRFFNTWFWVLAVVAGGRALFRGPARWIERTRALAYPFYIWHQTVIVVLVWLALPLAWPAAPKWAALVVASTAVTAALTAATARTPVVRLLFGMAPVHRRRSSSATSVALHGQNMPTRR